MKDKTVVYGYHPVMTLLRMRPEGILQLQLQENRNDDRIQKIKKLADDCGVKYSLIGKTTLEKIAPERNHQGVVAAVRELAPWSEEDLMSLIKKSSERIVLLVLDGVQDPHNLGACLRCANAFGSLAVIIPKDRAAGMTDVVKKVASGAAEVTPLIRVTNLNRTLEMLKKENVWLIGFDENASQSIQEIHCKQSVALVMGAEGEGLRRLTKESCDYLAKIPMQGTVESLNVSVATGLGLFLLGSRD